MVKGEKRDLIIKEADECKYYVLRYVKTGLKIIVRVEFWSRWEEKKKLQGCRIRVKWCL